MLCCPKPVPPASLGSKVKFFQQPRMKRSPRRRFPDSSKNSKGPSSKCPPTPAHTPVRRKREMWGRTVRKVLAMNTCEEEARAAASSGRPGDSLCCWLSCPTHVIRSHVAKESDTTERLKNKNNGLPQRNSLCSNKLT